MIRLHLCARGAALALLLTLGGCETTGNVLEGVQGVFDRGPDTSEPLSNETIAAGLKEALTVGTGRVVDELGARGGFSASDLYRIPLPPALQNAREAASKVGLGGYFDDLEDRMNVAAEAAAPKARRLFVDAIAGLTFADVMGIYRGEDTAATEYMRSRTATPLAREMRPVIDDSLSEVGAVSTFNALVQRYNALPMVQDIDADLTGHVLAYANEALFTELANQERLIRRSPAKRTTELLRQVFGR